MSRTKRPHLLYRKGSLAAFALSISLALLPAQAKAQFITSSTFLVNTNGASDAGEDASVRMATDGMNNWVAVWESDDELGISLDGDFDIFVARSSDNGANWSAPAALNTNAATDLGGDFAPLTVSAGAGVWVAFWESDDELGISLDGDYDILFARSTDDGVTWSAPAALHNNFTTDAGDDQFVSVTSDGGANWVAVWQTNEDPGGLAGPDFDIFKSTSSDTGATWSTPAVLHANFGVASDAGDDFLPIVETDSAGNWVVVWHSLEENVVDAFGTPINVKTDSDILVSRSFDNGGSWSVPQILNINAISDSGQDLNPAIAVDGVGNWTVVWDSTDDLGGTIGTDSDILAAVSTNNGLSWTFPRAINADAATDSGVDDDTFPSVGIKGNASLVYIWQSDDNLNIGGAIGTDNDILYGNAVIFFPRGSGVSGCFIATAAYGTPLDARLDTLREFRDETLLSNGLGSAFVDAYYRLSPPLADRVAENPALAAATRFFLAPMIALVSIFGTHPIGFMLLITCAFSAAFLFIRKRIAMSPIAEES